MKVSQGSSLVEYAIPTAILVVAVVLAFANGFFANDMSELVSATVDGTNNGGSVQVNAIGGRYTIGGNLINWLDVTGYSGNTTTLTFTTATGQTIILNDFPVELDTSTDTLGGNGTTKILAQAINELTIQLLAAGAITPAQAQTLRDLANEGHDIADVQWNVEYAAGTAEDSQAFSSTGFSHESGSYTNMNAYTHATIGPNGSEYSAFNNLYIQAQNDGSLSDPAVNALIATLVHDIRELSQATHIEAQTAMHDATYYLGDFTIGLGEASDLNSDSICTTGGFTSSGGSCS